MILTGTTIPLPGIYPQITHWNPSHKRRGKDNLGMGYTEHGEQFLLKPGDQIGVAEFVGAKICEACGIPACQPTIVRLETMHGGWQNVFGSRIESGVHQFDQSNVAQWQEVMQRCHNSTAFSAMLGVDLVLGNDDRHWDNWIVQGSSSHDGRPGFRLRAVDFSRGWPIRHPAQHPSRHEHSNTWSATKSWELLGVTFDSAVFYSTCATISGLSSSWLQSSALEPLVGVFLTTHLASTYCQWWQENLQTQVIEAIHSLEYGVRT